mmetsp:Transcript_43574/g.42064  ORF Transcript_43574/g.42064 Transcript_43574/m.42064 type:complete len:80 (+) Transcript_43574:1424-1663(+)
MKIADPNELVYFRAKESVAKILRRHIREAKRVVEIFSQFESIIRGTLFNRVKEFLKEDRREREYELLIKELRYYDKMSY